MGKQAEREKQPRLSIGHPSPHANYIRVKVKNSGGSAARGCYGKITIDHEKDDLVRLGGDSEKAFVTCDAYSQVRETNVCWAHAGLPSNPDRITIPVDQSEVLEIARYEMLPVLCPVEGRPGVFARGKEMIFEVPSEQGWSGSKLGAKSRVFLRAKTYTGELIVGSEDTGPLSAKIVLMYDSTKEQAYLQVEAGTSSARLPD
jgi:hypothetical protein